MKTTVFAVLAAFMLATTACSNTETLTFESEEVTLTAEGPLYDGSNTASATWTADLSALNIDPATIQSARVKSITITTDSPDDLALIQDITFQFAGKDVSMQQVGFLNPVPAGSSSLSLQIAVEQKDIAKFFQLPNMTWVSDVNLSAEKEENLQLKVRLNFELEVKK
jgi:ABC-type glycerol-3-phosphate transport system substrate-binding protein